MTDIIAVWEPTLESVLESCVNVKQAYRHDQLPEEISRFPCVFIMPGAANYEYGVGYPGNVFWELRLVLWTAREYLPKANETTYAARHEIMEKLAANMQLSNTVAHILPGDEPHWTEPGSIPYSGIDYYGCIGSFQVKQTLSGDSDWVPSA